MSSRFFVSNGGRIEMPELVEEAFDAATGGTRASRPVRSERYNLNSESSSLREGDSARGEAEGEYSPEAQHKRDRPEQRQSAPPI